MISNGQAIGMFCVALLIGASVTWMFLTPLSLSHPAKPGMAKLDRQDQILLWIARFMVAAGLVFVAFGTFLDQGKLGSDRYADMATLRSAGEVLAAGGLTLLVIATVLRSVTPNSPIGTLKASALTVVYGVLAVGASVLVWDKWNDGTTLILVSLSVLAVFVDDVANRLVQSKHRPAPTSDDDDDNSSSSDDSDDSHE